MRFHLPLSTRAVLPLVLLLAACGGDDPTTPAPRDNPSTLLGAVTVAPRAAMLAAGGTQQLTTAALALDGTVLAAYDTVLFVSADSSRVRVSPTGLITAATGSSATTSSAIRVIASVRRDGITRADTAYVSVVAKAPGVGVTPSFSIADASAAITKLVVNASRTISPKVTYFDGTTTVSKTGSAVPFTIEVTPDTLAARTSATALYIYKPTGTILVRATTTLFGVTYTDTISYRLGDPLTYNIEFGIEGIRPYQGTSLSVPFTRTTTIYLQAGGTVRFQNRLSDPSYVFGVSFAASNGGVAPANVSGLTTTSPTNRATVTFATPGTYVYTWTGDKVTTLLTGDQLSGTVVVR